MNPNTPIAQNIETLAREKNIDPTIIISAIEDAVVTASRKQFKTGEDLQARYNMDTGSVDLFAVKRVVEEVENDAIEISLAEVEGMGIEGAESGDILEFPRSTEDLGRIAAQTAKQIIFQKVREAERNNIYDEYIQRVGDIVHGYVKRFEGGRIIVDLGKVEAVLPRSQQSRVESFTQGERIRVVIHDVHRDTKGPQVEVSRTSPELLKRLFEMEVPEIYDGTVIIKAAVREPGDRAKIAVVSRERDVDPVGACVGMKGSRVQAIIRELRGERIDIIEWNEDPAIFAANSLSPAKVSKVQILDFTNKELEVIVPEEQLSLAIGRKGQNVRLAAKLIGWHVDIRSEEEMKREVESQMEALLSGANVPLTVVDSIDQVMSDTLQRGGILTVEQLAESTVDDVTQIIDMSFDDAERLIASARRIMEVKRLRGMQAAAHAEHEAADAAESALALAAAEGAGEAADAPESGDELAAEPAAEVAPESTDDVELSVTAAEPDEVVEETVVEETVVDEAVVEEAIVEEVEAAPAVEQAEEATGSDEAAEPTADGEASVADADGTSETEEA
ncbi:MAG: transcription termination/antitermination protein NusA [Blastocatellia bacterium]|nr:transcription termination/antitermination protein NusA [Blastocatellia bacterium]